MKNTTTSKAVIIRQPYEYSKRFLKNRITPYENRIMIKILGRIKHLQSISSEPASTIWGDKEFYFDAEDLVRHNDTNRLETVLKRLQSRTIELPSITEGDESITSFTLFSQFTRKVKDIGTNKGKVYLVMDKDLFKYILNLSRGYTQFLDNTAFNLSNSYSIKMYYHICHWYKLWEQENSNEKLEIREEVQPLGNEYAQRYRSKTKFTLSEFREEFAVPQSYRSNDIKQRILNPAKAELDKKAEVSFNYTEKKEGRKVVGFSFAFYRNTPKKDIVKPQKLSQEEQAFVDSMAVGHNLTNEDKTSFAGIVKKYGLKAVTFVCATLHNEIYNYKKNYDYSFVKAVGIILEGEKRKLFREGKTNALTSEHH